jgi:uncharacterized protein (TIGR02646 family)
MRALQRLPEPQILVDRKKQWLDAFLASGKPRPDSNKYAHESIRMDLNSMSSYKCFYCETKLKGASKEVDHHVEVSVDKNKAFEWTNLYLCCEHCNKKRSHNDISIQDALNPCQHTDAEIQEHLTFKNELIIPNHNSEFGLRTIAKYRLDTEVLDHKRLKYIDLFRELLLHIRNRQLHEKRSINQEEREAIESFKRKDNPYSLMFKVLLEKYGF